eukprot:CFRG0040T1
MDDRYRNAEERFTNTLSVDVAISTESSSVDLMQIDSRAGSVTNEDLSPPTLHDEGHHSGTNSSTDFSTPKTPLGTRLSLSTTIDVSEHASVNTAVECVSAIAQSNQWTTQEKLDFVARVQMLLLPTLDIVGRLPGELALQILAHVSHQDLAQCQLVDRQWRRIVNDNALWRILCQVQSSWCVPYSYDVLCTRLSEPLDYHQHYKERYRIAQNWKTRTYDVYTFEGHTKGIYCLQYEGNTLVSGSKDEDLRVWEIDSQRCVAVLSGHDGSVLCLQLVGNNVMSGSSDGTIKIWDIANQECLFTLMGHALPVLCVLVMDNCQLIISCSRDKAIKMWKACCSDVLQKCQCDNPGYRCTRTLTSHRAAVNMIQANHEVIVSVSGDHCAIVWDLKTGEVLRHLVGHVRGIACVYLRKNFVITGSSDFTAKVWDYRTGALIRTLRGHTHLVRCLTFNDTILLTGSYDTTIIAWDWRKGKELFKINELRDAKVYKMQFDDNKIISSGERNAIQMRNFANPAQ